MSEQGITIDLNADLGEDPSALEDGREAILLDHISSANIACGGHAGDARTMRAVIDLARARGVAVGAHPGYDDRAGFGRVPIQMKPEVLRRLIERQIGALMEAAESRGIRLSHVKPHGALYHAASTDTEIGDAILQAVWACDGSLALVAACGSAALRRWEAAGAAVIPEGFIDRRYRADGSLVPRSEPGAVIKDEDEAIEQGITLARDGRVRLADGTVGTLTCRTLCVHADTPGAARMARRLRPALLAMGVRIEPPRAGG